VDTIAEYEELRGGIERTHSTNRDTREKQYVADRKALVNDYTDDLADIEQARRTALVSAGLNPDGSDPQGRQQGS
jgi:hypothetical protein